MSFVKLDLDFLGDYFATGIYDLPKICISPRQNQPEVPPGNYAPILILTWVGGNLPRLPLFP